MNREEWWHEQDFTFEGTPCTYYIWADDRPIIFGKRCKDWLQVPTFDLRQVGETVEHNIRLAIQEFKERNNPDTAYCHIIRHKRCYTCIGIFCSNSKVNPTIMFAPYNDEVLDDQEDRTLNPRKRTDQWGIIHPPEKINEQTLERLKKSRETILSREYLVDDLVRFEFSLNVAAKESDKDSPLSLV